MILRRLFTANTPRNTVAEHDSLILLLCLSFLAPLHPQVVEQTRIASSPSSRDSASSAGMRSRTDEYDSRQGRGGRMRRKTTRHNRFSS
ncbi:hypothetical protein EV401DRAFT_911600 [Pisolithus croceorrhizus]|nr:hypothetical protein EV401DRAFT_911600 [Pisolithus croceorrhizus]